MLKAIHAQESKKAARGEAKAVVEKLRSMKLREAAKKVEDSILGGFLSNTAVPCVIMNIKVFTVPVKVFSEPACAGKENMV